MQVIIKFRNYQEKYAESYRTYNFSQSSDDSAKRLDEW